jgi:SAM-dependent methyltransferase
MEWLFAGRLLQSARVRFLADAAHCRKALVLGEGPGSYLVELLRRNPHVEVICVERSPGMIRQARKRLESCGMNSRRVEFVEADVLEWLREGNARSFDMIAAHYFFDCFDERELETLIRRIGFVAAPGALLFFSDFDIPQRGAARLRAKAIVQLLYAFFHLTTDLAACSLVFPGPLLQTAGFSLTQHWTADFGLVHSSLWRRDGRHSKPPSDYTAMRTRPLRFRHR